jgi:hypothetical protein
LQFNPTGVPERNAREDLLPRFVRIPRDAGARLKLYGIVDGERVEVDSTTV